MSEIHPVTTSNKSTYILLDGLVFSIVGYFYESRRILASP